MSMLLRRAMMMAASLVKHIISSVTGLVSFSTNVAADMPSVLCEFAPVQTGYNTPSPSNVRPISGWTGLSAFRGGNNAFDAGAYGSITGYIDANGKIVTTSSNAKTVWFEVKPNTNYTISLKAIAHVVSSVVGSDDVQIGLYSSTPALNVVGTRIYVYNRPDVYTDYYHTVQFNSGANTYVAIKIGVPVKTDINASIATLVAVETASLASEIVNWQSSAGTVYGGTMDVATGVLTVTMAYVDLGTLSWNAYRTFFYATVADKKSGGPGGSKDNVICDQYPTITYNQCYNGGATGIAGYTYNRRLSIIDPAFNEKTGAEVKSLLSGIYAAYEIDPYQTVQLTPAQIQSIIGTNNVWHNANGGITVEYYDNH